MRWGIHVRLAMVAGLLTAAGCGGGEERHDSDEKTESAPAAGAATGKIITVNVTTDEKGNYFAPARIEAHPGDVLRFTLVTGVHNIDFLPDSNAGKSGLPPVSDMLQLPGQTVDVPLTFGKGHFYFQCDPHAALGMVGHVEVE
jgi:plastocyanin